MGKIRIKQIGLEDVEKKQKEDARKRRATKRTKADKKRGKVKAPSGKGGERMKQIELEAEDLAKMKKAEQIIKEDVEDKAEKKVVKKARPSKLVGKKHKVARSKVKKDKSYKLKDAVALIRKVSYAGFDETVELHLKVSKKGLRGEADFPFGTGRKTKVAIADDKLLAKIEKGDIDFDVLVTTPSMMPKLAKHAKVLGPRGLMPNPKAGTVTDKPESVVKKFESGSVHFKTESKFPLIHQAVGKLSFKDEELADNIKAFIVAVGKNKIESVFLKSTMSPSVRLDVEKV